MIAVKDGAGIGRLGYNQSLVRMEGRPLQRIAGMRREIRRGLGLRLAVLALALNLLGPFAFPLAPVAASLAGGIAVICTAQGFRIVALDADGRPSPASPHSDPQCLFCLPLLKQGGAAPAAAPMIAPVAAEPLVVEFPVVAVHPRRIQARLIAAPRAPPFA